MRSAAGREAVKEHLGLKVISSVDAQMGLSGFRPTDQQEVIIGVKGQSAMKIGDIEVKKISPGLSIKCHN